MIAFRHADARWPFLWETADQPAGRWHGASEGPAHYFCDTPDGAWAEFLRHEEITEAGDIQTVQRALWAVDLPDEPAAMPRLPKPLLTGGLDSYPGCQDAARGWRSRGVSRLIAPSAALQAGAAHGWRVRHGRLEAGPRREGKVIVLFGLRPWLQGWLAAIGRPSPEILNKIKYL